ncbi:LysM peptidoglycan-binding domain-containing protein [Flavobacteriaceae bacterium TP-CH-4]|uniref:LysM peptidoglycan-binding domain-containing protein n=2 Tax=Pelagihabitans pacificus TaxID=2696054 RepID=A0A967ARQ1_9FLAO|nr:LysM peptidoglycan-binding domain-containing protein [Pelagihabitans pacificus]NHF59063.1 LysM peptidoglycan-binding domain-containing protein [Pelagihabitans pacificus]
MTKNIRLLLTAVALMVAGAMHAQEKDSLAISTNDGKIDVVKSAVVDTLSTDIEKSVEQMERMDETSDQDLPLPLADGKGKYNLKDHPQAAMYDSLWMKELYETNMLFNEMYDQVLELGNGSQIDGSPIAVEENYVYDLPRDSLKARLERLNQKTPFNVVYNPSLERLIKSFLTHKRDLMERMLTVSQFYFPLFEEEFDRHDIPLEMKYLSIVESALNPKARSRVGATGLWQFMYGTGKQYKLDVTSYVDERSDPIKATKAASQFLSKLYEIFGDWDLALAAYNSGPGNVNKAIRRSGGHRNYWNIRRNLPRETAGYVPAFLATMYVFEYAEEHGLKGRMVERPYFETDTIQVKSLITFDQISKLVGVGIEELKVLNPSYKLNVIPYVKGKKYALRLPKDAMGKFVANEIQIYAHVKKELESKESPLPALVKQAERERIRYKVRSGDYLGKIAERYGVRVSQLKQWNGLRSNNLRVGQRLTIYPRYRGNRSQTPKKEASAVAKNQSFPPGTKVHTVKSGDSLWTISRKYPGVSVENLRKWNGISGKNLQPGTKLKLCECSP